MKETRTCKVPEEAVCEGITVRVGRTGILISDQLYADIAPVLKSARGSHN
jgi:hypothetical protein